MNLIQFDHCLYKGNITSHFLFYCIKKKKIKLTQIPLVLILYFLSYFSKKGKLTFWCYLHDRLDLEENILAFAKLYSHKVNKVAFKIVNNQALILSKSPLFLGKSFLPKNFDFEWIGWDIDFSTKEVIFSTRSEKNIRKQIRKKQISLNIVIDRFFSFYTSRAKTAYLRKRKNYKKISWTLISLCTLRDLLIIFGLSCFILWLTFLSSSNPINWELYHSYYEDLIILIFNLTPILVVMLVIYLCSHQLWLSFLITEIPFGFLAYANYFKLKYRDYPVVFSDLTILSEAKMMAGKYDISPTYWHIWAILASLLIIIVLKKFIHTQRHHHQFHLITSLLLILGFGFFVKDYMLDAKWYDIAGDETKLHNKWIESQQIQRRGLVYPFIYSYNSSYNVPPANYEEELAKDILEQYTTKDIPEDEKINIVSIMLESYNDFTKFNLPFTIDVYESFHQFQEEGYYGEIASNVFGGGTVNTERAFITGYFDQPRYLGATNSYVHYLNSQGYNTVALHPCYGSFYNRRNVNQYLGYDEFYYVENRYDVVSVDDVFFPDIIEEFERQTSTGAPYFNYSLNYQGHGPYPSTYDSGIPNYIDMPDLDQDILNQVNYYFNGIKNTNNHLSILHDYFENSNEPVVLVLYGDHNPVFGSGKDGFEMMGINMDTGTQEGFKNYYYTPYVIWTNSAAKALLGDLPSGKGPDISPNFLMNELFNYLGWDGPAYMQYTDTIQASIPVLHQIWKEIDGQLTQEVDAASQEIIDTFKQVEYYSYTHYIKE